MARFLFGTMPFTGHVYPGLPIARELTARGHEVRWYTGRRFQEKVEASGARFLPMQRARDFDDRDIAGAFPERPKKPGLPQLQYDLKHIFADAVPGQVADLEEILQEYKADVLLGDTGFAAAGIVHDRGTPIPWAVFGVTPLVLSSTDTAPFGLGLPPNATAAGQLRNRALNWLVTHVLFRSVTTHYTRLRIGLNLKPKNHGIMDAQLSPYLYLQAGVPSFEYSRSDLPPQVQFIGAFLPDSGQASFSPQLWWEEVTRRDKPVILVTQGTLATDFEEMMIPALRGLADKAVLVIATTAGKLLESPHLPTIPANTRVAGFLPYGELMPYVDVLVTNGGFGTVQIALSHGIPIVASGRSEDKAEVCGRISWSGVGVQIPSGKPTPDQVRTAVDRVLSSPDYRRKAQTMQAEFARYDAPTRAADLLEELATTGKPVPGKASFG